MAQQVRGLATETGDLRSIPPIHILEGENPLQKVVLGPPLCTMSCVGTCTHMHAHTQTNTHAHIQNE